MSAARALLDTRLAPLLDSDSEAMAYGGGEDPLRTWSRV
jgi:hypothetical protein